MSTPSTARSSSGHWLPSIPALLFVSVLVFVIFVIPEPLLNSDGDLARHLRHGEWMLQHRQLITLDPFSYTKTGQPMVEFEYGSQLMYALVNRIGGLAGVTVFAALLIASAYTLMMRYMLRRGVEPSLAGAVVAAAIVCGMGHWMARPHLITMAAVPILLEILSPCSTKPRLWPFPVLFGVWANLHGGFVYGLVLIGIFLAAAVLGALFQVAETTLTSRARFYGTAFGLSLAATLATPHGLALHRHIIATFSETYVLNHTGEFASPNFHDVATKLFLWVLLGVLATAMLTRRRLSLRSVLVLLASIDFALVYQRNITLFGLTALPLVAIDWDADWRKVPLFRRLRVALETGSHGASTRAWVASAALLAMAVGGGRGNVLGHQLIANEFSNARLPVAAVTAARASHLSGRLFSDFGFGGYILYAWPEQKVFIDGGTDFYGDSLMRDYSTIRGLKPGWRELVRKWDFAVMVLRVTAPVAAELVHDGGWTYWYCDGKTVVIVREDGSRTRAPARPSVNEMSCLPLPGSDELAS